MSQVLVDIDPADYESLLNMFNMIGQRKFQNDWSGKEKNYCLLSKRVSKMEAGRARVVRGEIIRVVKSCKVGAIIRINNRWEKVTKNLAIEFNATSLNIHHNCFFDRNGNEWVFLVRSTKLESKINAEYGRLKKSNAGRKKISEQEILEEIKDIIKEHPNYIAQQIIDEIRYRHSEGRIDFKLPKEGTLRTRIKDAKSNKRNK